MLEDSYSISKILIRGIVHGRNNPLPPVVMGLNTGCCPDLPSGRHVIHGRVFKGASDQDGNHNSAGTLLEVPWVAIEPVVSAVRVLGAWVSKRYSWVS